MICGRYEGVDDRVAKYIADEVVSIGDYVLSGGEIPAMIVTEAVSRLIPGVLGKQESEESRRLGVGMPQYTRPENVEIGGKKRKVPKVLLSGDHAKIVGWRRNNQQKSG
jgi:tRNA (guanine37-N1)-methyltransferase